MVLSVASEMAGVETVDADKLAWATYEPGTTVYREVVNEFGSRVVDSRGRIDREKLAEIVFGDRSRLEKLESIVHPAVMEKLRMRKHGLPRNTRLFVVEGAKLLQSKHIDLSFFDRILLVDVDESTQLERLRERDGLTIDEARRRIEAQNFSEKELLASVDFVIRADGSKCSTRNRARRIFNQLLGG